MINLIITLKDKAFTNGLSDLNKINEYYKSKGYRLH